MVEVLIIALVTGAAVGMFGVLEKRKKTDPEPTRYTSSLSCNPECKVMLPGGLFFSYAMGALEKYGWQVDATDGHTVQWYFQAARRGQVDAQRKLGLICANGTGVPRDDVQAYSWLNLAAAAGDPHAGSLRDDLSRRMTREQITEAQRISSEWHSTQQVAGHV